MFKKQKAKRDAQPKTSYEAILFPIAGLLHDHELTRIYHKSEHRVWFYIKLVIYTVFTITLLAAWTMQDPKISEVCNYALMVVPALCMSYTHFIFSNRFGRLFRSNRELVIVHSTVAENSPEDAIFDRLRRA